MYNMWWLVVVNSTGTNRSRHRNYSTSALRILFCLVFLLLIIIALTVAGVYQQLTNICVAILFILTILFILYSVVARVLFDRHEYIQTPINLNQTIWTINNSANSNYEDCIKSPPSYETVINDPKYVCPCCQEPPSYINALMNQPEGDSFQPTMRKINNESVILNAHTLCGHSGNLS